ncbi:thioredoxin family protein [Halococcoides cellulosivorans]|uniref:Thioredoxin n=1 Tax=Halococcoides cellulosivorans TaxID=1679096 RepID=A0A2R4X189_9EURY|nr:thioredoxin family protein [Halococcoides cellulosivorans]AWB27550.1 thioredoxin family protein [Halococcoides cellulosivorans]
MNIEVIGPGCPRCQKTATRVEQAIERLDRDASIEKVEDQMAIIDRGVMHTPAVAVDGEIEIEGEIPAVDELVEVFQSA